MTAGQLKERVTIQKRVLTTNEIDETMETWEDYITVWAAVLPNAGNRFYSALQAQTNIKGLIKIRYRSDIDTTMKIKHGDAIYTINTIIHPEFDRKYLHIMYEQ